MMNLEMSTNDAAQADCQ